MTTRSPTDLASALPPEPTRRDTRALGWALAAAAGLSLGACQGQGDKTNAGKETASSPASSPSGEKDCCQGKNACKGKGGCAVPGKNDCASKNACKGQGGCNMHCKK